MVGNILSSITPLQLLVDNTIIETDWLKEAFIIVTDCHLIPNSTTVGEIVFHNYTLRGLRLLDGSSVLNYIVATENITFDNITLTTYALNSNAAYITYSTAVGCNSYDDGIVRVAKFTNAFISSQAPSRTIESTTIASMDWFAGTTNFRKNEFIYENITLQDMWSNCLIIVIWTFEPNSNITIKNVYANNVAVGTGNYAGLFYIDTPGQVNLQNFYIENSSTEL